LSEQAAENWSSAVALALTEPMPSPAVSPDALLVANLLNDLDGLAALLREELARESWLNAFLLAAGMNQIVEDRLHDTAISLRRVARHVRRIAPPPFGAVAAAGVKAAAVSIGTARSLTTSGRRSVEWQRLAAGLVDGLADAVAAGLSPAAMRSLVHSGETLIDGTDRLPARLRRSVIRLPSCFRNFDQRPVDLEHLTREFSSRWPDRERQVAVIGVRTSGSYTAPLHGAYLRALGYKSVRVLTYRPGQRWRRGELDMIGRLTESGDLALITDDAPKSGGSVEKTALELERLGFPRQSVVLLLQTPADMSGLPHRLQKYAAVVLPWAEWSVQSRLNPEAVGEALSEMLAATYEVLSVEPAPLPGHDARRSHLRARFKVVLRDRSTSDTCVREVHVKGAGLGYFGDHALAVAGRLKAFLPEVIGLRDGLLYRWWLPEDSRLSTVDAGPAGLVARAVVDYSLDRAHALPVKEDVSLRLLDRGAVWQRAADILSAAYGPASQLVRPLSHPLAKELLRVTRPSVIDGSTDVGMWFAGDRSEGLQKVDFDEHAFNSLDVYCYDHLFDVAGLAPGSSDPDLAEAVRRVYEQRTGRTIDPERWLLYRLVHVTERHRGELESVEAERELGREMQEYYRRTVLAGVAAAPLGPLCVFDLDWTLEKRSLGFAAITPAGASALRALASHGYRVAIASGRSVDEVIERCRAFGLAGGVAEYGAASFDSVSGRVREHLSPADRECLDVLREEVTRVDSARLDPDCHLAVRAYRFDDSGRRRGLGAQTIASVLESSGLSGRVRAIKGLYQTDFMVNTIDKGLGLRALADDLGIRPGDDGNLLALAVGDSAEDLPMMRLAQRAMAPANAEPAVRKAGVRILRQSGPLGAARAVAELIGHSPGTCPTCGSNHLPARSLLLLTALAAQDARGLGKVLHALRLTIRLAGTA
jgi:3-deoxy-D-manno-octulosonate 8-phosphate phosphatase KdsC-like HAD superfamily phosphatase